MVKAILFDFFGVLCSDEYWKFVKEDINFAGKFHDLANSVNLGQLSWNDFLIKVATETRQDVEEVKKMYAKERINLQLASYIDKLHEKYKTALLTNASESFIEPLLKKSNLHRLFDEVIISSKVGLIKPDPKIYEYATNKLGVAPAEAIFVDDTPLRVEGAQAVGMQAILYKNFAQFKKDLEQLLAGADS